MVHRVGVTEVDPTRGLDWIEGVAIVAAVVVVVLVTAFNDYSKERQFRGLQASVDRQHTFCVLRQSHATQLAVADVVVGDVCLFKYGTVNTHTHPFNGPFSGTTRVRLVAWHSGRTSISDRRTFPVLRSTCS